MSDSETCAWSRKKSGKRFLCRGRCRRGLSERTCKIAMMWKSMLPRFRNIERTFRFIEKSEGFSGPQALARHPAQSLAPTASYDDGIGQRPFLNDRLNTSGNSTPPRRGTGFVQSNTGRADVY